MPKRTAALAEFQIWCSGAKSMDWEVSAKVTNVLVLVLYRHAMQNAMVAYPETRKAIVNPFWLFWEWLVDLVGDRMEVVIANETWRKKTGCPRFWRCDRMDLGPIRMLYLAVFALLWCFYSFSQSSLSFASSAFASCFPASKFVARQYCLSSTSCQPES